VVSVHDLQLPEPGQRQDQDQDQGQGPRHEEVGQRLGAACLSASVYELRVGERIAPYHFDYGNEECALIVAGRPTLRDPEGEHELAPGDVLCFPVGPEGVHELCNRASEPCRVLVFRTTKRPAVTAFPDQGTLLVDPPGRLFAEREGRPAR
jgi:uncharacterized cupin superfamily protein